MICKPCQNTDHDKCYDKTHSTDYASCFCQHRQAVKKDEPTGDPKDC